MDLSDGFARFGDIHVDDPTYRITTDADTGPLARSIAALGLIRPPIFLPQNTGFAVVSGFRRVRACLKLGWPGVKGRFFPPGAPHADCVHTAIADNTFARPLNLLEQSRAFALLWGLHPGRPDRVALDAATLGLPDNPDYIDKVRGVCRMPGPVQEAILADHLALPTALLLNRMGPEAAATLAGMISALGLGLNRQRELITLVREIAAREDADVLDVLGDPELQGGLEGGNPDRGYRARRLMEQLKRRRFPALSLARDRLERQVRGLALGSGLSLQAPVNFEGDTFTLTLTFRGLEELARRVDRLKHVLGDPTLQAMLENPTAAPPADP